MRPIQITIEGFGPYRERFTLNIQEIAGLTALYGPTGAGKSTLANMIYAALYGQMPDYAGNLYDAMTAGGSREARVELVFDHRGERYRAERTLKRTDATSQHKARLWRIDANGETLLAGPKERLTSEAISNLIGPPAMALATWFQTRRGEGDLFNVAPAARYDVFSRALSLDHLTAKSKRYGDAAIEAERRAEFLDAQIAGAGDPDVNAAGARAEAAVERASIAAFDAVLADARAALDAARARFAEAGAGEGELRARIAEHDAAAREAVAARAELDRIGRQIAAARLALDHRARAEAETAELAALKARRQELEAAEAAWRAHERWGADLERARAALEAQERLVAEMAAAPGASASDAALAARLPALRAEYVAAKTANDAAERANREREAAIQTARARIDAADRDLKRLEARAAARPETPAEPEVCARCPLMREWGGLEAEAAAARGSLDAMRADLAGREAAPPDQIVDLAELMAEGARAKAAAESVERASALMARREGARARLAELREAAAGVAASKPAVAAPAVDPGPELRAALARIAEIGNAPEKLAAILERERELADLEPERALAAAALAAADTRREATRGAADAAREALEDRARALAGLRAEIDRLAGVAGELEARIRESERAAAAAEERARQMDARAEELRGKRADSAAAKARAADLRDLQRCFGPRGAQPILIDRALPEIERLANAILAGVEGPVARLRLRYSTQAQRKDGSMVEEISIGIARDGIARDAGTYSGGETQFAQAVNRLALMLYFAAANGTPPDFLCLDEAGNNTDDVPGTETTGEFVGALRQIADKFSLLLLVTPKRDVAMAVGNVIELRPTFAGAEVV